jgi:hypothetical protein
MRVAREYRTPSKENYEIFCDNNPTIDITFKQFQDIIRTANKQFYIDALETGEKVKLPFGFGSIAVHKYKPKFKRLNKKGEEIIGLPIDWKKSSEEGSLIYNMNFHTDGYRYKWKLFINDIRLFERHLWVMKPTRYMSRELARYIFKDNQYHQLYKNWSNVKL